MLISRIEALAGDDVLEQARRESGGGDIVVLDADSDWRDAADRISSAVQIDVRFPDFKDGRGFTLATQLRNRAGFDGHLRATGDLIPDQARFLKRVGFDSVSPDRTDLGADWERAEQRFSVVYQPANDASESAIQARTRKGYDLQQLNGRYRESDALEILRDAITHTWKGRIAALSSFGAETAVGLHMISRIDPYTPVLFLDTGRHFAQTEQYQRELTERLGLKAVRLIQPQAAEIAAEDADSRLWSRDADACCALRKVRPLDRILGDYEALITGRKQMHGGDRVSLPIVERINSRFRINPLASWTQADIEAYFERYDLPRHPLSEMGYTSIGCWTCTAPPSDDNQLRSGRWEGQSKTECGIHTPRQR